MMTAALFMAALYAFNCGGKPAQDLDAAPVVRTIRDAAVAAPPAVADIGWSFGYDGRTYREFPASWRPQTSTLVSGGDRTVEETVATDPQGMTATLTVTRYRNPTVVEWTLAFENRGKADSARFMRIAPGDFTLGFDPTHAPTLWRGVGEVPMKPELEPTNYSFSCHSLTNGAVERFVTSEGYPSFGTFPYFRVFDGTHGYGIAVGWQGAWYGEVAAADGCVRVTARQETVDFYLKPGERVISPTVTVLPFTDTDDAVNRWRRFMRRWILPRERDGVTPIRPILGVNGHERGDLYSRITCDRQLELIRQMRDEKKIDFDIWWVDAGWTIPLGAKNEKGKPKTWYETNGLWTPDVARFPAAGFGPVSAELAQRGSQLVLWHEPERVHRESPFFETARPYLVPSKVATAWRYDLTNPKAFDFISDIIVGSLVKNGVDFYREDSNGPGPLNFWVTIDEGRRDGRRGLAENIYIQARFRLWEKLRAARPGLRFDICASGGRRNDLSTLRFPSVPLHYSDVGYWNFREKQHYNELMNEWLFYRKNIAWAFHPPKANGFIDRRHAVIDFAPMHMIRTVIFLSPAKNAKGVSHEAEERQLLKVWRDNASLMIDGDYYALTPPRYGDDTWWVTEFFDPQAERGFFQVVRNPESGDATLKVRPRGVRSGVRYVVRDAFSGVETSFVGGEELTLSLAADDGTILEFGCRD